VSHDVRSFGKPSREESRRERSAVLVQFVKGGE
jgi:hypothetical protein